MYAVYHGDKPRYFADEARARKCAERTGGHITGHISGNEEHMAIEGEIERLTGSLKDGIDSLNKKVQAVSAEFDSHIKEGHAVVDAVDGQGKALKGALAHLKAAMGMNTNFPPTDATA